MKQGPFAAPSEPSVFECQQARYVWGDVAIDALGG